MYLHFNMRRFKALSVSDSGKHGEYYFTWRCYVDKNESDIDLAQGFSLGCPIDEGYSMKAEDSRLLNDPKFSVEFPEVAEGETKRVTLDLFAWESDSNSEEVKKLFTNEAAAKLMEIHQKAEERKKKTQTEFLDWIENDDNEVVKALVDTGIATASSVVPYIAVTKAAFKLTGWVFRIISNNSDDFLGFSRAEIIYTRMDGQLMYRWIFNNGVGIWFKDEKPVINQSWRVLEADRGNELDMTFGIQVISSSPDEFLEAGTD